MKISSIPSTHQGAADGKEETGTEPGEMQKHRFFGKTTYHVHPELGKHHRQAHKDFSQKAKAGKVMHKGEG